MPASNTLVLVIEAQTNQANSSIQGTNKVLASFETQAIRSALNAGKGFEGFEKSAIRAAVNVQNRFSVLGGTLGANLLSSLASNAGGLAESGLRIAASFERSQIGLEAFLGSAQKANSLFSQIQDFALQSPFEFKDLLVGANRLLAFEFAADQVVPTLKAISSAVGALGGDIGKVNDLIAALGQIQQAGKLTGEELRQLRNAGVEGIVIEALGEAYGKTAAEINKAVRQGIIPGKDAVIIATRALERRFGEFNERVSATTEVGFSNVADAFGKASDQAFKPFLGDINNLVRQAGPQLEKFGKFIRENADAIQTMATAAAALGAGLAVAQLPSAIASISTALTGLAAFAVANPFVALAAGVAVLSVALVDLQKRQNQYVDSVEADFVKGLLKQNKSVDEIVLAMKKHNDELLRLQQNFGEQVPFSTLALFEANAKRVQQIIDNLPENKARAEQEKIKRETDLFTRQQREEFQRRMKEQQQQASAEGAAARVKAAETRAAQLLLDAQKSQVGALAKIRIELAENLKEYGLTKKAIEDIGQASTLAFEAELRRASGVNFERQQQQYRKQIEEQEAARARAEQETQQATVDLRRQTQERAGEFEIRSLDFVRDRRLADLETIDTRTVQGKIAVEQQKNTIEAEYLTQRAVLQIETLQRLAAEEIAREKQKLDARLISEETFIARRNALVADSFQQDKAIQAEAAAAIDVLNRRGAATSAQIQRQYFEEVFGDAKQSVENLWDQFTRQGETAAQKFGNLFRLVFNALAKEVVSTFVARQIAPVFAQIRGGSSGSQGGFLGLGGLLGGLGQISRPGAPGGTGGFAGPVQSVAGLPVGLPGGANLSFPGQAGALGSVAPLGLLTASKNLLTQLGQLGATNKAFANGVFGAKGGALLAGGGILAFDGLRRGGLFGLGETTAGGALIGAKFGGPIGALIGGAIGAAAGLARLFIKGAAEKAREKIRSVYGVDISSNDILNQAVSIAKSSYGGNLDVAIRSQEVRDIVELYAMATGQNAYGIQARQQPLSLSQNGGVLSVLSNYSNGRPVNPVTGGPVPSGAPMVVQLQLDPAATQMVLEGRAVAAMANNPRVVQGAVVAAQRSNAGRQQAAVNMFSPGLILS